MANRITTVGQLKNFINVLPDDMLVISLSTNYAEQPHMHINMMCAEVKKVSGRTRSCVDMIDGTFYSTTAYENDEAGVECLVIN